MWKQPSRIRSGVGHDEIWAGPLWLGLRVRDDCRTREIVGWNLSHRCRTEDALAAVEQAVLERLPEGSRQELDADDRQWNAVHFFALPGDVGETRHHPSADGLLSPGRQQLHRTVPSQLERGGSLDGRVSDLGRSANFDRSLDRGVQSRPASPRNQNRTPHEAFLAFAAELNSEALTV